MSKWVSYGYEPPDTQEAKKAREIEQELLREYLPVILTNSERILETPRYFYCQLGVAWLSSMWLYAGGPIPLGVLILLWDSGEMLFECPSCSGTLHAVGLCGSLLSGSGSAWGVCRRCQTMGDVRTDRIGRRIVTVGNLLPRYVNRPIVEKGKHPLFDWKEGLKGESIPDTILVPAVEALDFWELVCELTGMDIGEHRRAPLSEGLAPQGLLQPITLEKRR
jgi:hypothetical protein